MWLLITKEKKKKRKVEFIWIKIWYEINKIFNYYYIRYLSTFIIIT